MVLPLRLVALGVVKGTPWDTVERGVHLLAFFLPHRETPKATARPVPSRRTPNTARPRRALRPRGGPISHHRCCSAPREEKREKTPGSREKTSASTERRGVGEGRHRPSPPCLEGAAGRHEVVAAVVAPASVIVDATLAHLPELELAGAAQDSMLRGLPLRRKELTAAAVSSACSAGGQRDREGGRALE
jgi:hypothetical protein